MAYAECFVLMLPLRECAGRCRVCLKTAYTMRHRLIECLSAYSPSFKVERGCGCELDETYFPESFKGNHTKGSFTMPRPSRQRGKQVHRRGLSRERICERLERDVPRGHGAGRPFEGARHGRAEGPHRGRLGRRDRQGGRLRRRPRRARGRRARGLRPQGPLRGNHQPDQHRPFAPRRLAHGVCRSRVRDMFNVEPPYMDYWAAPAA